MPVRLQGQGKLLVLDDVRPGHRRGGCSVEGCGREHYSRGLCRTHHAAALKRLGQVALLLHDRQRAAQRNGGGGDRG